MCVCFACLSMSVCTCVYVSASACGCYTYIEFTCTKRDGKHEAKDLSRHLSGNRPRRRKGLCCQARSCVSREGRKLSLERPKSNTLCPCHFTLFDRSSFTNKKKKKKEFASCLNSIVKHPSSASQSWEGRLKESSRRVPELRLRSG